MQEPRIETQTLPPPPGIIGSLRAGFDVTAGHITAILMPVVLDIFLWLGPRLSMDALGQRFLKLMNDAMPANSGLQPADVTAQMARYQQFIKEINLLVILRTFPVGISSLLSGKLPGLSPLGTPVTLQVDSYLSLVGLIFLLTLTGWIFGGLYFRWVAALVTPETLPIAGRAVLQTLLYSLIWLALWWMLFLPAIFIITLLYIFNSMVGLIVLVILSFVSMWLIVPIFFSPHGMFVKKQNAFVSILSSFQMARFTLPSSSLFVVTIFLAAAISNYLWSIPTNDSWLMLVGILGHAFITTALLASTFIYYQKMTTWLQTVLTHLQSGTPTQQA